MYKYIKKISLFAIVLISLFMSVYSTTAGVYAEEYTDYNYNSSSVISDLNDGEEVALSDFFPSNYLANVFGEESLLLIRSGLYVYSQDIYLLSFIESGYGSDKFGVYLYVYNPKQLVIDTDSIRNKVQFSLSDKEEDVFRSQYSKYKLEFINATSDNVYLKFKVKNLSIGSFANRYYAVSGLELSVYTAGGNGGSGGEMTRPAPVLGYHTIEYKVGAIYYCRTNDSGVTTVSRKPLETIEVDVTHVYYRTDDSQKGPGWSNQLSACYFALPKAYSFGNNPYGRLSEILAEFYLYYTKPILVLNNLNFYRDFVAMRGISTSSPGFNYDLHFSTMAYFGFVYNIPEYDNFNNFTQVDTLYWVIPDYSANFDDEDYYLSKEKIELYYNLFSSRFDLMEDEEYFENNNVSLCGFDYGYNVHTYSISEEPEEGAVLSYDLVFHEDISLIEFLLGQHSFYISSNILPLVQVEYSDLNLSDDEFSEKYLVAKHQVSGLKDKLRSAGTKQEVWLFRYDCSEYFGSVAYVRDDQYPPETHGFIADVEHGLVCQEPVYLDWDILSFTFEQESIDTVVKTVIPVIHSPEDVFSDLTRSKNDFPVGDGCADYKSMFSLLLFLGGGLVLWFVITKIIRYIRGNK